MMHRTLDRMIEYRTIEPLNVRQNRTRKIELTLTIKRMNDRTKDDKTIDIRMIDSMKD